MRLAVLVSGSGTLLDAMVRADLPIALVVADRTCRGLELVERSTAPSVLLERKEWGPGFDRNDYSARLTDLLVEHEIDLVAMAGFGTILAEPMFAAFPGRIINTHPALLPAFPGWHAVAAALEHGVKVTGCTIHVATPVVDDGPILAQEAVAVEPDDTEAALHERIKVVERRLYIDTLLTIHARGRVLDTAI
ncbi:MAG: phosphoribosylglycinamide formyltransferase [Acidimicrobiales bacterium]